MFEKVLQTPIRFFDINPIGRIMNRFSKDIGQIDETIPITVLDFMNVKVSQFLLKINLKKIMSRVSQ